MKTHAQAKQDKHSPSEAKAKNQASEGGILQAYKKSTAQLAEDEEPVQRQENKTGLPDNLKSGVENLSGHSLDDVKVHYNSSQPASLQAHAYAQGTDIHVAPGQEKHLPHEAWHVVQQKQGRVQPTRQLKGTTNINDDTGLENEADVMGAKALNSASVSGKKLKNQDHSSNSVLQGYFDTSGYSYASHMWGRAEEQAKYLNQRLDIRTAAKDEYADELKVNLEAKGLKASTTIAGEAYETLQWDQPKGKSNVIGPGGTSGGDLKEFIAKKNGGDVTDYGEVKSTSNNGSFKSSIANAYTDRKQTNIIMYTLDEALPTEGETFKRSGESFAVSYNKWEYWLDNDVRHNFVATVKLVDQGYNLYLYKA